MAAAVGRGDACEAGGEAVAVTVATGVRLRPIAMADLPRVGAFLEAHLTARVPAARWVRAFDVPWAAGDPNCGFMLHDGDDVVGVHLAFYSTRHVDGVEHRFCNLGAWCVLPEHRFHALRLLKAVLAQPGMHFTDLSPSGNVPAMALRLGFRELDTASALVPNLPWPSLPRRVRLVSRPAEIERTLRGDALARYRDHARAAAARQVLLVAGGEHCHVIFRKDRRRGLPVFASLLHVSDPELLRRHLRPFTRHLLLRHGALATLVEDRLGVRRPRLSRSAPPTRKKLFRSPSLAPEQVDYLYSELVCVPW